VNDIPAVLSLSHVQKSYGPIRAIDDVSLQIRASEFVGLLGPNGAGKSTMFQLISGLFAPDAGTVTLFGMTHRNASAQILAQLGVVFQARSVDLDMTIRANLSFHGRLFGLSGKALQERIEEQANRFGFTELLGRQVRQLSGGQQRKVEIARALLNRPRFLIMDEPSAGLDSPSRRSLVQDMQALVRDAGVAILWATHLVDEVENADRIILLRQGQVVADDTPAGICKTAGTDDLTEAYSKLTGDIPQDT